MAKKKTHGKTAGGKPITEEMVEKLARRPRPATTSTRRSAAARPTRDRVRPRDRGVGPPGARATRRACPRAKRDDETPSSVIRKALRQYLKVG